MTLDFGVEILDGATVTDVTLSRTVVFSDAAIQDATLEDTIVDRHATVAGVSLCESTVGYTQR